MCTCKLIVFSNNVVLCDHIMILREELDKFQAIKGLKCEDNGNKFANLCALLLQHVVHILDPTKFLGVLFKHVLNVDPLLRIK